MNVIKTCIIVSSMQKLKTNLWSLYMLITVFIEHSNEQVKVYKVSVVLW